jgi:hypothetical protein
MVVGLSGVVGMTVGMGQASAGREFLISDDFVRLAVRRRHISGICDVVCRGMKMCRLFLYNNWQRTHLTGLTIEG